MDARARFDRRAVLKGGLAATVIGSAGVAGAQAASAQGDVPVLRRPVPEPLMHGTEEWGARPPAEEIVVEDHPPTYIVVHHTVEPGNVDDHSLEHAFKMSRAIQNFHMDGRGWIDTGQQFTNSRGGHITEGRHRSLEILREGLRHVQGANVANRNSEVIGIENEGLYTEEDVTPALWDSLVDLVSYMSYRYNVPPELIKGHRDFNSTQCPGDVLYARLPELRREVARRTGKQVRPPREWPLLRPGDSGRDVRVAQRLLRARGFRSVPADGVFGPSTAAAVRQLAAARGTDVPSCIAAARSDERGFLGADLWPVLVTAERSTAEWKVLLARRA